jgi:hypothetical protein
MIEKGKQMTSPDVLLALVCCEIEARYNGWGSWQVSAEGALPVVLLMIALVAVW